MLLMALGCVSVHHHDEPQAERQRAPSPMPYDPLFGLTIQDAIDSDEAALDKLFTEHDCRHLYLDSTSIEERTRARCMLPRPAKVPSSILGSSSRYEHRRTDPEALPARAISERS